MMLSEVSLKVKVKYQVISQIPDSFYMWNTEKQKKGQIAANQQ